MGHTQSIEPSCRSEYCSAPPFTRTILPALNTFGHGNGWVPVCLVTQFARHWNPIKCTKMVPSDPKLNAFQGTELRIWIGPLVFPLFWNEMTKNVIFLNQHFLTLT